MFYVFNTCKHFIRTLPALVYSQVDVKDVDTEGEDHIYDECRYVCMENPCAAPLGVGVDRRMWENDPLNLYQDALASYAGRMKRG